MMKIIINETQLKYLIINHRRNVDKNLNLYINSGKKYLKEGHTRKDLPQDIQNAINQVEKNYGVKITDDNIEKEFEQENTFYKDNGKIDNTAFQKLKEFLDELYKKFPNAPKPKNSNCNNLAGCQSGYRGYITQVSVFGGKIKEQGGVSGRQRASALPGFSQHSTGKTFDILDLRPEWWNSNKDIKDWVANNCGKFGFKISYQKDGVLRMAEPWHLYYIGELSKTSETKTDNEDKKEKPKSNSTNNTNDDKKEKFKKFFEKYFEFLKTNEVVDQKSSNNKIIMMQVVLALVTKDDAININGTLDENTKNGITKFQKDNGLTQTGYFDLLTQKTMGEKISSPTKNTQKTTEDSTVLDKSSMIPASSKRGQTYGWRAPIGSLCSQGKNQKRYCNWHWHAGRDYSGTKGTPIVLLKGGKMIEKGSYCFKIEHNDGSITKYCHCDVVYYDKGDTIPSGSIVSTLGNKGPSTGPHLHFEYYPSGNNTRTETKNKTTVQVKDVDPVGVDDTIFAFVKPDSVGKFKSQKGKI